MPPGKRPASDPVDAPEPKVMRTTLLAPAVAPSSRLDPPEGSSPLPTSLLPPSPGGGRARSPATGPSLLGASPTPRAAGAPVSEPPPSFVPVPIPAPGDGPTPPSRPLPLPSPSPTSPGHRAFLAIAEPGPPALPPSLLLPAAVSLLGAPPSRANLFYEDTDSPRSTPPPPSSLLAEPHPSGGPGRASEWGCLSDDGTSPLRYPPGDGDRPLPPAPAPHASPAGPPQTQPSHPTAAPALNDWEEAGPFYGLPEAVRGLLAKHRGVAELYPWQQTVLREMRRYPSFLFSLPTSSGKTLVAEMALLRALLGRRRSALLVLPFVSLAEEKREGLEPFGAALGFEVLGYYGVNGRFPIPKAPGLLVCTIEKANSVLNHLMEENRLDTLGTVVVDELHMVGEEGRGATLEVLLAKLRFACPDVQVVGMSATVPNLQQLGAWLQAGCFEHDHRPVPLKQFVKVDQQVLDLEGHCVRTVAGTADDPAGLLTLIGEVCPQSSLLIFCATKRNCQECALAVCRRLPAHFREPRAEERRQLLQDLRSCSDVADPALQQTVPCGVAYHHSGLTMEERELLERAFRQHWIVVLCCTSTLAAGVNLPAKRVIFRTPYVGRTFLTKSRYLQMAGRAGRKGCDPYGESFLLLQSREQAAGWALVRSGIEPCTSQLAGALEGEAAGPPQLEKCVMEVVATGLVASRADLRRFVACTLAHHQAPEQFQSLLSAFQRTLDMLLAARMVDEDLPEDAESQDLVEAVERDGDLDHSLPPVPPAGGNLRATPFGLSAYKANFSIKEANFARTEFERLLDNGLILSDELHLCYLVTPFRDLVTPDWAVFLALYHQMSATRQRISQAIGISERLLLSRSVGQPPSKLHPAQPDKVARDELVLKRFFAALVLCDVVSENPMAHVEAKYKLNRGAIQALLKAAQVFANMMVNFSNSMGWFSLERVLAGYVKRLGFGVKPDLVPLTEIKGVQAARARALWNAGFRQVKDVARVDPEALLLRLRLKCKASRMLSRRAAQQIVDSARALLRAQAKDLQAEAEELLAAEGSSPLPS